MSAQKNIAIGTRIIGPGHKPFIIAEIAQNHDGSLGMAHAFIDLAASCGADAVKFQTHIAAEESTLDEKFRIPLSGQDATRYDYWRRMEFTADAWQALARHAAEKKIIFLSSAFSVRAVELLRAIGMPAWKIGSGETLSAELMAAMAKAGGPLLLSTGMSPWKEIDSTVETIKNSGASYAVLQCTSQYPTRLEDAGINVIDELRTRYHCPAGLSDHSGLPWPSLVAMARGADIIEAHLTFHKSMYGPDVSSSLTPEAFKTLTDFRDALHIMDKNPVDKNAMAERLKDTKALFTKSIAPARALKAGDIISDDMLAPRKPGTGIHYAKRNEIIGRRLKRDVSPERLLQPEDLME